MAAVNDVYRIALRMFGPAGQDFINVWHCRIETYSSGDDADVAAEIIADLATAYQALESSISSGQSSNDISVVNVTTSAVLGSFAWPTAFLGTAAGDVMPPQSSLYSYFRTGFSRRIARKFWGVVNESLQDSGLTIPIVATQMATFIANFISNWLGGSTGNTYDYGIYNQGKAPQYLPLTEALTVGRLMTQRRRRPGVGA